MLKIKHTLRLPRRADLGGHFHHISSIDGANNDEEPELAQSSCHVHSPAAFRVQGRLCTHTTDDIVLFRLRSSKKPISLGCDEDDRSWPFGAP